MWDYIIVGGGAAGCVLANRLSTDDRAKVLLLEAGPKDRNPFIHMPIGFSFLMKGPLTWGYSSTPQKNCNDRSILLIQGRVIGGCGSINAMIYTCGVPADYDRWANEDGCPGWSFKDVQPYFIQAEDNERLASPFHGYGGCQGVSDPITPLTLSKAFVKAAQEFGLPFNSDFNGENQEGTSLFQTFTRDAKRCHSATGYLRPATNRKNLQVKTGYVVTRLVVENGKAVGVEVSKKGRREILKTSREVIVSAGGINSPKLLLQSGIGPKDHLSQHNIKVVADIPGVGQNLHDHYDMDCVYELNGPYSLEKYNKLHWKFWTGLEYLLFKSGPVTSNAVEGGAFSYANKDDVSPDIQFHFLPAAGVDAEVDPVASGFGCTINSYFLRPRSRGSVKLQSSDPTKHPLVDPNYLDDPYDVERTIDGINQARDIMSQQALSPYIKGEHLPGPQVKTKKDVEEYARQFGRTSYHHVGTCKMGTDDMAVVDPHLKVRGVDGLRVIDSSIMPSIVSSNTYAATVMIAEKGSDLILKG